MQRRYSRVSDVGRGLALGEAATARVKQRLYVCRAPDAGGRGHALCGPIYVEGAKPGTTLKVSVERIVPHSWGWSRVGDGDPDHMARLGLSGGEHFLLWDLDVERRVCRSNAGHIVPMRPFMGVMTVTPDSDAPVRTHLPGVHGGNLDCKELVAGSTLYLPVLVEGALFSTGDGHARQGDGESGCTAIECPMREVRLTFEVVEEPFSMLVCNAPCGWITFGFDEDLTAASYEALRNMARLMGQLYGCSFKEALNLCGAVVDLRATQIVNGVRGGARDSSARRAVRCALSRGSAEAKAWREGLRAKSAYWIALQIYVNMLYYYEGYGNCAARWGRLSTAVRMREISRRRPRMGRIRLKRARSALKWSITLWKVS